MIVEKQPMLPVRSVKMRNRVIWLDGDPFQNYILPLTNAYSINDLAKEILRACAEYNRSLSWEGAQYLAKVLLKNADRNGDARLEWD